MTLMFLAVCFITFLTVLSKSVHGECQALMEPHSKSLILTSIYKGCAIVHSVKGTTHLSHATKHISICNAEDT